MCVSCACDGAFGGRFSVENRVVGAYKGQIFSGSRRAWRSPTSHQKKCYNEPFLKTLQNAFWEACWQTTTSDSLFEGAWQSLAASPNPALLWEHTVQGDCWANAQPRSRLVSTRARYLLEQVCVQTPHEVQASLPPPMGGTPPSRAHSPIIQSDCAHAPWYRRAHATNSSVSAALRSNTVPPPPHANCVRPVHWPCVEGPKSPR